MRKFPTTLWICSLVLIVPEAAFSIYARSWRGVLVLLITVGLVVLVLTRVRPVLQHTRGDHRLDGEEAAFGGASWQDASPKNWSPFLMAAAVSALILIAFL
ncbi:hypothetical protein DZF91_19345 [Actinomadura logoneensis]|uniref:Uncharacterized protein n=1 Tax=Actinomadura logoneensis TaxID=2293572 RepID=A0A372JJ28_9ACTN|nr:hypothetical protein [Actinomadura logoneensis]RFU40015.1 hypothetical protein DZF91_19345 [Actinomadura logoneensis]